MVDFFSIFFVHDWKDVLNIMILETHVIKMGVYIHFVYI